MQVEPEKQEWRGIMRWRPQEPVFGRLSLWGLGVAAVIAAISFLIPMLGSYGEGGMAILIVGLFIGGIASIGSLVLAVIGLARRENPRWPAITGLLVSLVPALGGVYLLCGAPW